MLNTGAQVAPRRAPNPPLTATYDGYRRKRHMILVYPGGQWGGRAYGLGADDDFRFQPPDPKKGQRVTVHLSDATMGRLIRQRDLRAQKRYGGRR